MTLVARPRPPQADWQTRASGTAALILLQLEHGRTT
jgi:hypothetical protein